MSFNQTNDENLLLRLMSDHVRARLKEELTAQVMRDIVAKIIDPVCDDAMRALEAKIVTHRDVLSGELMVMLIKNSGEEVARRLEKRA